MVRFSIIITNYNGLSFIKDCLDSLENQIFKDFEVIFVDNNSIDNSVNFVKEHYSNVIFILNSINRGYGGGCNDGAKASKGDYLFFLNTDTTLLPDCLLNLDEGIHLFPDYGMYAPKMIYPNGKINSTGLCISLSGAAWDRGLGEKDIGQYDKPDEIFGPCGGAAVFKREPFLEINGFDESFFLFMEDVDIIIRMQSAGWKCRFLPHSTVVHHHGGITGVGSDFSVYYGNRNIIWNTFKNYPDYLILLAFFFIFVRNLGSILYYGIKGRGRVVLRAKWDAIKGLPPIIRRKYSEKKRFNSFSWMKYMKIIAYRL